MYIHASYTAEVALYIISNYVHVRVGMAFISSVAVKLLLGAPFPLALLAFPAADSTLEFVA